MANSRWFALILIVLGVALLLATRIFLPLTDAQLAPVRAADYVPAIAVAVLGLTGLITMLVGAKKIVATRGRANLRA